jgi:PAS domain S-box-containing protein
VTQVSLLLVASALGALALFVWRANRRTQTNTRFAILAVAISMWVVGVAGLQTGFHLEFWARFTFAAASLIPPAFLAFMQAYPVHAAALPARLLNVTVISGGMLALLAASTDLVVYDTRIVEDALARKSGPLYPVFAAYFVVVWCVALANLFAKWRNARGLARAQIQYLGAGIVTATAGGIGINLLLPLATGFSTYSWVGPYFTLGFLALVAHAIIRHRLMDLRLVVHRGLTVVFAVLFSLIPVGALLLLLWPRIFAHMRRDEVVVALLGSIAVALLIAPTRDAARRILDRYVYRTQANYQRTVRDASSVLTKVLDLKRLLNFITETVVRSTEAEGAAVYLRGESDFGCAIATRRHDGSHFDAPETARPEVVAALERLKEPLVTDEIVRAAATPAEREVAEQLTQANWSLVLPVISDSGVIALIAVGPKLSGDPFYPQDLDLLMTLANQAGIAIKNARLYAQVVLANEYIENIVATIESGVLAITSAGRVAMFNRAAERLTGLTADAVRGQPIEVVQACLSEPLLATVADGQARTNPESELVAGDARRPVMCTTSPVRDSDGVVQGAVAVFSDLTALKELENERRRAERLAYFEVLASGIAHEIKNPLVGIKTFTQLVPRRRADDRFIDEFTRVVGREIDRMERLLERLEALSRPGRRPQYPLDVRAPIAQAVEAMQPTFDEKGVTVSTALGQAASLVLGHHGELEQLFLNLVMNAHAATPPGGTVHVDVTHDAQRIIVNISDTGPGIAPELVERVFDPFFSTKQRGSGLGLAICAGIAQTHGARLRAANRPGGGAVFSVEFAMAPQPAKVDA